MQSHMIKSWAVIVATLMVCGVFLGMSQISQSAGSEDPVSTAIGSRGGTSPRTVLVEKFTADWCTWCVSQAWTIGRLANEVGHENMVVLEHHASASDELYQADSATRGAYYNFGGYPTVIFDGGGPYIGNNNQPDPNGEELWIIGGWPNRYTGYSYDRSLYEQEKVASANSNMTIEIEGNITGSTGYVHARITATDPIMESNLKVRFAVYQNEIYHRDSNTVENAAGHHRVYNHVVRKMLPDETLPGGFNDGDSVVFEKSFTIDSWYPSTDKRKLGIAVYVQTDNKNAWQDVGSGRTYYNAPVLQAASHDFVHNTVLLVNGDTTDIQDEGFERFDDVMTKMVIPYTAWDTFEPGEGVNNQRAKPTLGDLSPYGAVVWFTGQDTTALSAADRTTLETYLSAGGNIMITGEEIANAAQTSGWTSWLLTNLHASFVQDTAAQMTVDGVPGDPITNGLTGLGVFDASPDRISLSMDASAILQYQGTTNVAGLRATHDVDSRVVYVSFDYFEGTNTYPSDINAETLMDNAVYWLDGVAPPVVQIVKPSVGELVLRETEYTIKWTARDVEIAQDGVDVEYTTDGGLLWNPIVSGDTNDGAHYWSVPAVSSSDCKVRVCVRDSNGQQSCMESGLFRIGTPNIPPGPPAVTGAYLSGGSADVTLEWTASGDDGGGFNDVVEYDIYTSLTIGGPQTYVGSETATDAPTYSWACLGCGDGDPNTYFFHVWADDGEEVTEASEVAGKFVRPLAAGWSLVSFPLVPADTSTATILQTVDNARAKYYNSADPSDLWKTFDSNQNINDLTNIDRTMGFWLYTSAPDDFVVAGMVPTSTDITLRKGWNLVGFPSFSTSYTVQNVMSVTSVSQAEAFDPVATPHHLRAIPAMGSDQMITGDGYWMYATSFDTWNVL